MKGVGDGRVEYRYWFESERVRELRGWVGGGVSVVARRDCRRQSGWCTTPWYCRAWPASRTQSRTLYSARGPGSGTQWRYPVRGDYRFTSYERVLVDAGKVPVVTAAFVHQAKQASLRYLIVSHILQLPSSLPLLNPGLFPISLFLPPSRFLRLSSPPSPPSPPPGPRLEFASACVVCECVRMPACACVCVCECVRVRAWANSAFV